MLHEGNHYKRLGIIILYLHDILENVKLQGQKTYQWFPGVSCAEKGWTTQEHKSSFSDGTILYLDSYLTVCICQNSQN